MQEIVLVRNPTITNKSVHKDCHILLAAVTNAKIKIDS